MGVDPSGLQDSAAAIQAAIDAAPANSCLKLPEGTFRLNSSINLGGKDNITLRGAGPDKTVLKLYNSASVSISAPGTSPYNFPNVTLTARASRGSRTITVSDASDLISANGLLFQAQPPDDVALPVLHVSGFSKNRSFVGLLRGGSGSTVTIEPALPFDLPVGTTISRATGDTRRAMVTLTGLEDLKVDAAQSSAVFSVVLANAYRCWIRNVSSVNANNYNLNMSFAYQCEIRHCVADGRKIAGTNGAGLLVGQITNCLIEDNIFVRNFPLVEINTGCIGNVFAYNFFDQSTVMGVIGSSLTSNHGPHNSFNLFEGNIIPRFQSDGYFGGDSHETLFRNWIHGTAGTVLNTDENRLAITLNRFSRHFNIVANILGRSGLGISWNYSNVGHRYNTTSGTTNTISSSGTKMFTVATGLLWNTNGSPILAYSRSQPGAWMTGECASYGGDQLSITVRRSNGGGSYSDWVIVGGGGYGGPYPLIYALGAPNIGNGGFSGAKMVAAPSLGVWWRVWDGRPMTRRGAYNSNTVYQVGDVVDHQTDGPVDTAGGNSILQWIASNNTKSGNSNWDQPGATSQDWQPISPNSFQELDYDVYSTLYLKGNWNAADGGIPQDRESLGSTRLQDYPSLYRDSPPTFFGTMKWPAFDPEAPNQRFDAIPAGYRYLNPGQEAPGIASLANQAPSNVRVRIIQY